MSEIKVNINFNYYPAANEECKKALNALGYTDFYIQHYTGSHHANIYFFGTDEDKFKEELLGNTIIGKYRKFYFSSYYNNFDKEKLYYNVQYTKIKK